MPRDRHPLPAVTRHNLLPCLAVGYVIFCGLYLGSAFASRAPMALESSALDRALPFVAASIIVYLSQFLLLPAALALAREDSTRSRAFYAMLLASTIAAAIFLCFPTSVARPTPPSDGLLGLLWRGLFTADTTQHGFPSLHVALAAIAAVLLWKSGHQVIAIVWPMLVILSTLTTRQHVAWDIVGGLALAVFAWWQAPKLPYERTNASDHPARR